MTPQEIQTLATRLAAASFAYHNGQPLLMTDAEFDAGIEALRAAAPQHPFLTEVGAPVAAGDEVDLPLPLPSLNKIKPDGSLEKWTARFPAAVYHVSVKLDGCSALWLPRERKLYTRGDGLRGRDISAFARYFRGLAQPIATTGIHAVRGELILRTDSPAIPTGKLARNIVAGALNRKAHEADPALFQEIRFVAYELVAPADLTPEESYRRLRAAGFETARASVQSTTEMTTAALSSLFSTVESKSPYQMDGIVVAPNIARSPADIAAARQIRNKAAVNPPDRVAWKTRLEASVAVTTVRSVEWNVSASGILIPRVLFDTVALAGANISAATGLHGRWIWENRVGPGARIEVRRAGDVIPQILAVHVEAPAGPAMPAAGWLWDGDAATAVHIRPAAGTVDTEQLCVQLTRGLGELGAENVGPGQVAKLVAAGFTTLAAIYAASQVEFAVRVEGWKGKMAEKVWKGLRVGQSRWTELTLLCASCTMPRGVGHTKLQPLLEIQPNPAQWSAATFQGKTIPGVSSTTLEAIQAAIPAYLTWRTANFPMWTTPTATATETATATATATETAAPVVKLAKNASSVIAVFTGFRDKALADQMATAGHTVADTVTKKTTHLVYPDGPEPTSVKITKAREQGIQILSRAAFCAALGL